MRWSRRGVGDPIMADLDSDKKGLVFIRKESNTEELLLVEAEIEVAS